MRGASSPEASSSANGTGFLGRSLTQKKNTENAGLRYPRTSAERQPASTGCRAPANRRRLTFKFRQLSAIAFGRMSTAVGEPTAATDDLRPSSMKEGRGMCKKGRGQRTRRLSGSWGAWVAQPPLHSEQAAWDVRRRSAAAAAPQVCPTPPAVGSQTHTRTKDMQTWDQVRGGPAGSARRPGPAAGGVSEAAGPKDAAGPPEEGHPVLGARPCSGQCPPPQAHRTLSPTDGQEHEENEPIDRIRGGVQW